ncbi:PAS-domain containing protein [Croceicoccus sp. F390]|uniref:histidine kinase n=1 Tax=Croceicoccus esteveae TaxID=3075597 RepID=A0ABU2ZFS2_9SPHN|nr:PAS-domain containing protein [Croceicoccus sp. F390]MDT0575061.1 PAS-domain containing protein [Croceicoccus sp. F390]
MSIVIGPLEIAALGLVLFIWTAVAIWMILRASRTGAAARRSSDGEGLSRLTRLMKHSPAQPMLVHAEGQLEARGSMAEMFALPALPRTLADLSSKVAAQTLATSDHAGTDVHALEEHVRETGSTGKPFAIRMRLAADGRVLALSGHPADARIAARGAVVVWVADVTQEEARLAALREEARLAHADCDVLANVIDIAPWPLWLRDAQGQLELVNQAYASAVGAASAHEAVRQSAELAPAPAGLVGSLPGAAADVERVVQSARSGEPRTYRVMDWPVGDGRLAGYAESTDQAEQVTQRFHAFRQAQQSLLDHLPSGVAQFSAERVLILANATMHRMFHLSDLPHEQVSFDRLLDRMRDAGRLPEARDFPQWRRERNGWFEATEVQHDQWMLADGTQLHIIAQPMPDGGLTLIVQDLTEQLRISSARDTLLRVRSATLDNLFEALTVLAPDGRLQFWNRRFGAQWNLGERFLAAKPHVDALLTAMRPQLQEAASAELIGTLLEAAILRREHGEMQVTMRDGRTLSLAAVPLPDGNGLLTTLDVTDSQRAEAALIRRNQALLDTDAQKTRFLAGIGDELRRPVHAIMQSAAALQDGSQAPHEVANAMRGTAHLLSDQIDTLLAMAGQGSEPVAEPDVDMEIMPLMVRLVHERAAQIEAAGLTLNLRGDRSAGMVTGKPDRLALAIGAIIDAAIADTSRGGKIDIGLTRRRGKCYVDVRHRAAGQANTDPDDRDAGEREAARQQAMMGLPQAREIIEAHGGTFEMLDSDAAVTARIVLH